MTPEQQTPALQKRVRELEAGMVLARPAHTRDGSRLFPEGKVLAYRDIERLKKWKTRYVFVEPPEQSSQRMAS